MDYDLKTCLNTPSWTLWEPLTFYLLGALNENDIYQNKEIQKDTKMEKVLCCQALGPGLSLISNSKKTKADIIIQLHPPLPHHANLFKDVIRKSFTLF